jgi:hypothetical protein
MIIKAIETSYKGYRFRSRLEARWAIYFDAIGIPWQYEPEGFDLTEQAQGVIDLYRSAEALHNAGKLLEAGTDAETYHFHGWSDDAIAWMAGRIAGNSRLHYLPDFYLPSLKQYVEIKPYMGDDFLGGPEHSPIKLMNGLLVHGTPGERDEYEVCVFYDVPYWFGFCPVCKTFGYGFCAWAERICPDYRKCGHRQKDGLDASWPNMQAIIAARSARFEHGERS